MQGLSIPQGADQIRTGVCVVGAKTAETFGSTEGYWVYVLDADYGVKVGLTGSLARRLNDFERALGFPPTLVRAWPFRRRSDAWEIEQTTHVLLADSRTSGEWFQCHPFDAVAAVERARRMPRLELILLRDAARAAA